MSNEDKSSNGQYLGARIVGNKREDGRYDVHLDKSYICEISGKRFRMERFHSSGGTLDQYREGKSRILKLPVSYIKAKAKSLYEKLEDKKRRKKEKVETNPETKIDISGINDLDNLLTEKGFVPDSVQSGSIDDIVDTITRDDDEESGYNLA